MRTRKYYTAEVSNGNGQWFRAEKYQDTFHDKYQAIFAAGRQEELDELDNIKNRMYRIGIYEDRRGRRIK
jgi:hypothetical protein